MTLTNDFHDLNIAILLACENEGTSIANVIQDFQSALPDMRIFVYNNNSSDNTAQQAAQAGAIVIPCSHHGKGQLVRQMFADIDADIYIMADGDGSYDIAAAPKLIQTLLDERADMVVGTRRDNIVDSVGHADSFGNMIFNSISKLIFRNEFTDIFSGYRVFTRRFVKSFPAMSPGFAIATEMSVHASALRLPVVEVECDFYRKDKEAESKLSHFRTGLEIIPLMGALMKENRPFLFFSMIASPLFGATIISAGPALKQYFATGLVAPMPIWALSMTLMLASIIVFMVGVILDSIAIGRNEQKRTNYLAVIPTRGEKRMRANTPFLHERRGTGVQNTNIKTLEERLDAIRQRMQA